MKHVSAHVGSRRESKDVCLLAIAGIDNVGCMFAKRRRATKILGVEAELKCLLKGRIVD